ncbi:hypothetical protein C6568_04105 [Melaminivora suipulveris]|uniref:Uncharacterized protein n=1 Tax=Melaminivora suipulveris TaxID=2109913 RepID=A0A2R3Q9V1_9BURK|nr:hypothetical protein [Melaminivora suipulveris]AVO48539.1 hypothetical protein C6568_04105 [Melaminivora suipulveris]
MSATTKRKGRGKAQASLELIEASRQILAEIQPASIRAICYRLFVRGLLASMAKNETNKVSKQLVYAREQGIIPWEWIVDETRELERAGTWNNPEQIISAAVRSYRRDYWQDQAAHVEVWSEKGTVRGTVAPVLQEYGVNFRAMHGFSSATVVNSIAEESAASAKPWVIFYIGDFDPSGMYMSDVDLPRRLTRYGGKVTMHRIALLRSDTVSLPSFDAKTKVKDGRHAWYCERYGHRCWELDAMPPPLLRQRVEQEIRRCIDMERWARAVEVERAETDSMRSFMTAWQSNLRLATKSAGGAA